MSERTTCNNNNIIIILSLPILGIKINLLTHHYLTNLHVHVDADVTQDKADQSQQDKANQSQNTCPGQKHMSRSM